MSGKAIHKHIILNFIRALNDTDARLIERFLQMGALLPNFQILLDELTAENQRIILKARLVSDS